jgi:hypothetical protein
MLCVLSECVCVRACVRVCVSVCVCETSQLVVSAKVQCCCTLVRLFSPSLFLKIIVTLPFKELACGNVFTDIFVSYSCIFLFAISKRVFFANQTWYVALREEDTPDSCC